MDVSEIIARPQDFVAREASIHGFLFVGADSRLVADPDHPQGPGIVLPHAAVRDRMLSAVPPGGGGRYIYWDHATVVGVVADQPLRFVSVRMLVVRRGERQVWEFQDVA